jgi:CheY-like chemotaxis protein
VLTRRPVLIIEDDEDLREMMCLMLAQEGFESEAVSDGAAALDRLRSEAPRPQVILLDMMMPCMDGWEFCRQQALDPALSDIPVIVLSAAPPELIDAPGVAVLTKPFDPETLVSTLRDHY